MNFFVATKLTTLAIALGIASIVYMTPNKSVDITIPAIEYSNLLGSNNSESGSPEPATMLLFGTGLVGFASVIKRKKK